MVIVPKYRQKVFFGNRRKQIGEILRQLCRQKEVGLVEGNAVVDHIHMVLSIPPKYSVAMTLGYLNGKSAARIHRELMRTQGTFFGRKFWARGYCVSTVGLEEANIRAYPPKGKRPVRKDADANSSSYNPAELADPFSTLMSRKNRCVSGNTPDRTFQRVHVLSIPRIRS